MFDRFCLMDVVMAAKRHAVVWFICLFLVMVGVGIYAVVTPEAETKAEEPAVSELQYVSSASYIVIRDYQGQENRESTDLVADSRTVVNELVSLTQTDFCKQYVLDIMLKKYKPEEILSAVGKESSTPMTLNLLSEYFSASNFNNSMLINIFTTTPTQQFSLDLLNAYDSFVKKAADLLPIAELRYAGKVNQTLQGDVQHINDGPALRQTLLRLIKNELMAIIVVAGLGLLIFFTIALFRPTMNTRADFTNSSVECLGEIPYVKSQK